MVASPETASHTQTGRYSASTWICFKTQFRASTYLRTLSMSIAVLTHKFTTNITAYHLSTKLQMLLPLLANHGLAREIKSFLTSSTRIGTSHAFLHLYNFFLSISGHRIRNQSQPHHWLFFLFSISNQSWVIKSHIGLIGYFSFLIKHHFCGLLSDSLLMCLSSVSHRQSFLGRLRYFRT